MTISDASKKFHLSKSLLYQLCRQGRLNHYRVGVRGRGKILVKEDDVQKLLDECRVENTIQEDGPLRHIK